MVSAASSKVKQIIVRGVATGLAQGEIIKTFYQTVPRGSAWHLIDGGSP